MQATPLAGCIFLSLLRSYRLKVQDNRSVTLGIFLTSSTMSKALWWRYYSQVLFTFASVGLSGYSVKLETLLIKKLKIDEGEGNSPTKFSEISLN